MRRAADEADAGARHAARRAAKLGVWGTKMRSVIEHADKSGIAAIVHQQFEIGEQIAKHGLVPILEPEVSIKAPDKSAAEEILRDEIKSRLDALPEGRRVMLKLTIPDTADLYAPLIRAPRALPASSPSPAATRATTPAAGSRRITA